MDSVAELGSSHGRSGRTLLVGDIGKAFLDADRADQYPCDVEGKILDAIDVAARRRFAVIGVVMEGIAVQLGAALKALRKSSDARIVLLAQMHEEPIARRLTERGAGAARAADAYLICPTHLAQLCGESSSRGAPSVLSDPQSAARLEQRMRHLEYLATTDDLTGLRNRRYILEFARQVLERAGASDGRVTLLLFDIDNFKHYNDLYGHLTGDEILKQAGILMRRCCRSHDVVGRIGGDEFAVVFWDDPRIGDDVSERERRSTEAEHPTEPIAVAKRFQKEFGNAETHLLGPGGEGVLTISGGLASFPRDGATIEELLERADFALLEAKRSGKNRIYLVGQPRSDIAEID